MEFKIPSKQFTRNGGLSDAQVERKALLEAQGNSVVVVYGYLHAMAVLGWYLALPKI